MIFSSNDKYIFKNLKYFLSDVYAEIVKSGFKPNINKTSIMLSNSRQKVTGLVINKKIGIVKEYRKNLRAMCYNFFKNGNCKIKGKAGNKEQLLGMLSFVNQIDKNDNLETKKMNKKIRNNHTLNSREKLYREFLFYNTFYNNQNPILITEGKTDNLYLKAAIMKRIVNPMEFSRKNSYSFDFRYLNYSNIYAYLFGGSKEGENKAKSIYYYFKDENSIERKFDNKNFIKSSKPIIFLLDNEKNSDKPLPQFIKNMKLSKKQKEELKNNFYTKLDTYGKAVYLVVIPKHEEKDYEIEDLFDTYTLSTKINGRSFSREDVDPKLYYNKNIFAKYILKNFQRINFTNFKELLNILQEITSK